MTSVENLLLSVSGYQKSRYNIGMISADVFPRMGVKPGNRICLVDAREGMLDALYEHAPADVVFTDYLGLGGFDQIWWWPQVLDGLSSRLEKMAYKIRPEGGIWLVIPKKKFASEFGIRYSWIEMQALALLTDLVDNKTASFSAKEYATRFVIRKEHRIKYG